MKKIRNIFVGLVVFTCLSGGRNYAKAVEVVQEVIRYDDGSYAEVILDVEPVEMARTSKTGTKSYVKKNSSGLVEFTYTLQGTFNYTGKTATARQSTTKYNTVRNGWVKKSDNHYCSGNKAYATGKFSNSSGTRTASLTLTCSSTGKIS